MVYFMSPCLGQNHRNQCGKANGFIWTSLTWAASSVATFPESVSDTLFPSSKDDDPWKGTVHLHWILIRIVLIYTYLPYWLYMKCSISDVTHVVTKNRKWLESIIGNLRGQVQMWFSNYYISVMRWNFSFGFSILDLM